MCSTTPDLERGKRPLHGRVGCMVGSAVSNFDDDHMMINIIVEKFPAPCSL